jgi:hypothetical protein
VRRRKTRDKRICLSCAVGKHTANYFVCRAFSYDARKTYSAPLGGLRLRLERQLHTEPSQTPVSAWASAVKPLKFRSLEPFSPGGATKHQLRPAPPQPPTFFQHLPSRELMYASCCRKEGRLRRRRARAQPVGMAADREGGRRRLVGAGEEESREGELGGGGI